MKNLILLSLLTLIMTACNSTTVSTDTPVEPTQIDQETTETVPDIEESDSQLQLTLSQLAEFDGKDGQPAYIAVDGIIYDVSDIVLWSNGNHNGFEAGQDLTEPLNNQSPHGASKLKNVPAIGVLLEVFESSDSAEPETPIDETEIDAEPTEDTELPEVSNANEETTNEVTESSDITPEASEETLGEDPDEVIEATATPTIIVEITDTDGNGLPEFNLEQLLTYNGLNGQPAYFAYKDLIYDVSLIHDWAGGEHNGNYAGYDLTEDLAYAPHGEEKLKRATVVGELVK